MRALKEQTSVVEEKKKKRVSQKCILTDGRINLVFSSPVVAAEAEPREHSNLD